MIESLRLTMLYAAFAVVAAFSNILAQEFSNYLYSGDFSFHISILIGTLIGLVVKYFLDKNYIFKFQTKDIKHTGQTFLLYTFMGVFTTLIFWGFEYVFDSYFQTKQMRYIGGLIGLGIGYICKYYLDKHYVFKTV